MDALFTAVDLTTLGADVTVVLVALIGVSLLFLGYKKVRAAMGVRG